MKVAGLVMAGGAGSRMLRSGSERPKPLVRVRGRALLEHNVRALLASGITDVYVSVSEEATQIRDFVDTRCRPLVLSRGGVMETLIETTPLGNIGCLSMMQGLADVVVVLYADNLTSLRPLDLLSQHAEQNPALTLAAHWHSFQMPFGELQTRGRRIVGYSEKPITKSLVCSAVCIAGPNAIAAIPSDRPTGLSQLTQILIADGKTVESYEHEVPWIDVNDLQSVDRAEQLIADHSGEFSWLLDDSFERKKAA